MTDVIATKTVTVRFSVADGTRSDIEIYIENWLAHRSSSDCLGR
jgi:hypothetical protein